MVGLVIFRCIFMNLLCKKYKKQKIYIIDTIYFVHILYICIAWQDFYMRCLIKILKMR